MGDKDWLHTNPEDFEDERVAYVFKCPECGYLAELPVRDPAPTCSLVSFHLTSNSDAVEMKRDYRSESVNMDLRGLR